MEDLTAASVDDVKAFFRTVLRARQRDAGDRRRLRSRQDQGAGRAVLRPHPGRRARSRGGPRPRCGWPARKRIAMEAKIQQPQLYVSYPSPANFAPGDRELDLLGQPARQRQVVAPVQAPGLRAEDRPVGERRRSRASCSPVSFEITASPMPGHTLDEILAVIDEEIAGAAGQAGRRRRAGPREEPARIGHRAQPREPAGARRAPAVIQLHGRRPRLPHRGPAPLPRGRRRRHPARRAAVPEKGRARGGHRSIPIPRRRSWGG